MNLAILPLLLYFTGAQRIGEIIFKILSYLHI